MAFGARNYTKVGYWDPCWERKDRAWMTRDRSRMTFSRGPGTTANMFMTAALFFLATGSSYSDFLG